MDSSSILTRTVQWLLDLEHIRLGRDAPLSLYWQSGLPLWFLCPLGALTVVMVALTYRRESGGRFARTLLAVIRVAMIALVVTLVCQPVLKLQRDRIEPSHVALLIDTSRSMLIKDTSADPRQAQEISGLALSEDETQSAQPTRIDLVRRALLENESAALQEMLARNRLEVYSFGRSITRRVALGSAERLPMVEAALQGLVCNATATNIPHALSEVLRRTESGRLAAIVLASDGRTTDKALGSQSADIGEVIETAKARQVPIYTVLIGSPVPRRDISVEPITVQDHVFLQDSVALRTRVAGSGLEGPTEVTLRLIRDADNVTVAKQTIVLNPDPQAHGRHSAGHASIEVELRFKPEKTGRTDYRIEAAPLAGELETENNLVRTQISVIDEKLHVLYVDGYPRFEYRYLKNALLREPTFTSSCLLLSADPDFAQEGTDPIRRFPETAEALRAYDVVLFGDVDPTDDWLSPAQQEMLAEYVLQGGGGFGLIAGPRHAPLAFLGTPLEKLIPVHIDPEFLGTYPHSLEATFQPQLTADGRHSRIFQFTEQTHGLQSVGSNVTSFFNTLPGLYWIARTLGPKAGAEVLCEHAQMETRTGPMPLMVLGRFGAGRVFFSASDETWRWRLGGGGWIFDSFWLQVCRALRKPKDVGADRRLVIRTDRGRYRYGERVQIQVEVLDTDVLDFLDGDAHVLVRDGKNRPSSRETVSRLGSSSRLYEGSFVPSRSGSFLLELEEVSPLPGRRRPSALIYVADADLELGQPEADHDVLYRLAAETGGKVMELDEITAIVGTILDRSVRIPDDISEPLWDSKLVLTLFILMIGIEWILRKACGML